MDKQDSVGNGKKLMTRREFLIGGTAVIVASSLVACAPKTASSTPPSTSTLTPTSTSKYGGVLKLNSNSSPESVGWPADMPASGGADVDLQPCLEPLLHEDSQGKIHPWLAESYKVADDLMSVTFNLRKGVKFHDGSDFNAEAAKWNLDNVINSKSEPSWASADIIDDYTIRVNFTKWDNTVLDSFADSVKSWIVSKVAFDKNGIGWMRENAIGTGPFKFVSFYRDASMKFVRNTGYWGKDEQGNQLPYLDGVEWTFVADPTTKKLIMQANEIDMVDIETPKEAADMKALGLKVIVALGGIDALMPDTANTDSPWTNQKVREALEYAIDRDALAKTFGYGFLEATYQIPPLGNAAYDPNFTLGRKYDLDKSKQLLAEAGHPDGFKTTIITLPFSLKKDVVAAVQGYLAKAGIQAEIENPDAGKWMSYQYGSWHNSVLWGGVPIYANFNKSLSFVFLPSDVVFKSWLRTPEFTKALNATIASPTPDPKLNRAVTDLLTRDASYIPVFSSVTGFALQPYVMDTGVAERSLPTYVNYEKVWLNNKPAH